MELREVNYRVKDNDTYPGNRTSKSIKRKEFRRLYPDVMSKSLHFIFIHEQEQLIPEKQAKFLLRKYGKVIDIIGPETIKLNADEKAKYNVDDMKRSSMINLAARMDIKHAIKMKNEPLREAIKAAMLKGVEPITQAEHEERKKARA